MKFNKKNNPVDLVSSGLFFYLKTKNTFKGFITFVQIIYTMKSKIILILATFCCLILFQQVKACSCMPPGDLDIKEFNQTEAIFIGTVTKVRIDSMAYQRFATFKVTERIKLAPRTKTITIRTALNGATCGIGFREGQTWVVYAGKTSDGTYITGLCNRTTTVTDEVLAGGVKERFDQEYGFIKSLKKKRGFNTYTHKEGTAYGKVRKGCPVGEWTYYDKNGSVKEKCTYKRNQMISCEKPEVKVL